MGMHPKHQVLKDRPPLWLEKPWQFWGQAAKRWKWQRSLVGNTIHDFWEANMAMEHNPRFKEDNKKMIFNDLMSPFRLKVRGIPRQQSPPMRSQGIPAEAVAEQVRDSRTAAEVIAGCEFGTVGRSKPMKYRTWVEWTSIITIILAKLSYILLFMMDQVGSEMKYGNISINRRKFGS